jgi:4-amino-4-deoxy-L-arabinose transferase-like glycosyltransferase
MKIDSRLSWLLLSGLVLIFFLFGLAILPLPFLRDQGIYAYIAWCWREGLIPYRDAFGHKGPLLYAIYALSLGISKGAMWGPNLTDLFSRGLSVILIYLCGRMFFDSRTGILAAFFTALPLMAVFNSCWWNAQAETFMIPLLVLSLILAGLFSGKYGGLAVFASGILAALAMMLKSTAGLHAIFLLGYLLWSGAEKRKQDACLFLLGLLSGCVPWLIYFAAKGAIADFYEAVVVFNSFHAGLPPQTGYAEILHTGARGLWAVSGWFLILVAIPVWRWLSSPLDPSEKSGPGTGILLGWFLFSFLQVAVQMKFFLYHWLVLIPALGLMMARGLLLLLSPGASGARIIVSRVIAVGLVILQSVLFLRFYFLILHHYQTWPYLTAKIDRAQYYARFQEEPRDGRSDVNFLATWTVAHDLRKNTKPGDKVLVFGYEPAIYYLAARRAASRFHSDYPLTFPAQDSREKRHQERWRDEFLREIEADPPLVIILVRGDRNALEPEDSYTQAQRFVGFFSWLSENYQFQHRMEDFEFFVRK